MLSNSVWFLIFLFTIITSAAGASIESSKPKSDPEIGAATLAENLQPISNPRSAVSVSDQSWISSNIWNMFASSFAVVFIIAGLGIAFYYFYYINMFGYSGDGYGTNMSTRIHSMARSITDSFGAAVGNESGSGNGGGENNWTQVLYLINLAQEAYEKYDFQNPECQKKAFCELSGGEFGKVGTKILQNVASDMPTILTKYWNDYRGKTEDITNTNSSSNSTSSSLEECKKLYPDCKISFQKETAVTSSSS